MTKTLFKFVAQLTIYSTNFIGVVMKKTKSKPN